MRIIHSRGFPEEERHQTRAVIYSNIVIAFKVLLDIMNAEDIDFEFEKTKVNIHPAPSVEDVDSQVESHRRNSWIRRSRTWDPMRPSPI